MTNRLPLLSMTLPLFAVILAGCSSTTPRWIDQPWTPIEAVGQKDSNTVWPGVEQETEHQSFTAGSQVNPPGSNGSSAETRVSSSTTVASHTATGDKANTAPAKGLLVDAGLVAAGESTNPHQEQTIRGQDPGYSANGGFVPSGSNGSYVPPVTNPVNGQQPYTTYSPQETTVAPPATTGITPPPGYFDNPPGATNTLPPNYAPINISVGETQTGKITFGGAYNSNSGLVGQIIIDERNFDIAGFPRSFSEIAEGTAWRGAGQGFRLELVPGSEVQRYLVSFTEPYLFDSAVSFSASGYFFDRRYFDWDEQRLGGRLSLGYRLTPDLSVSAGLRMEDVNIHDPRVNTSPSLNSVVGSHALYLAQFSLINDTRDHPFMASQGSYLELSYNQGFGDFDYPRGDLDYRRYFLVTERPDGSGRHTLSFGTKLGFSGTSTPIFENYYAGGFATLRGFDFRGASPLEGGVRVGGRFQWLNSLEYTFPITADDMFKGVLFCDFGTVEQDIEINSENFRVAPGFGFRVHMPVGGAGGAPLAFDFAFPVSESATDDKQVFSFYMSAIR